MTIYVVVEEAYYSQESMTSTTPQRAFSTRVAAESYVHTLTPHSGCYGEPDISYDIEELELD